MLEKFKDYLLINGNAWLTATNYISRITKVLSIVKEEDFSEATLADFLREWDVEEVVICGLALDYCVKNTALDAVKNGFKTRVFLPACKAISSDILPTIGIFADNNIGVYTEI